MAALRAELDTGGETDAAMAFLATAIKDHGAVPASNMLLRSELLARMFGSCSALVSRRSS